MRRRKNNIGIVALGFTLLIISLFTSCESEKRPKPEIGPIPDVVSFSTDIVPTFQTSCATADCHGGTQVPDLRPENAYFDLTSGNYIDTQSPENSFLYQKITGTGSMAVHSNVTQQALILKWIQQGAEDN